MDNYNLEVLPVKQNPAKKKLKRPIDPRLPDISTGQVGMIIAPIKSGKSTIISNLLLNPNFYKDLFDNVYIISNTINQDDTSRFLRKQFPNTIYDNMEDLDNIIGNIIETQSSFPKEEMPFIAIILDDFLGIKPGSKIFQLASRSRHFNIGLLIFASQLLRAVPSVVRANSTFAIMGGPQPNQKELIKATEEFGSRYGGERNYLKLYDKATEDPYNFLYLDLQSNPSVAYKNFNQMIYKGNRELSKDVILKNRMKINKMADEELQ
jgi:hypothetical protein